MENLQTTDDNNKQDFEQDYKKIIETTNQICEDYVSSSEEECEQQNLDKLNILSHLCKYYNQQNCDENHFKLGKTTEFLEKTLYMGTLTCLICIGSIRHKNSIWSCKHCYCCFHLDCICRWAVDSLAQHTARSEQIEEAYYNNLGEYVQPKSKKPAHWCCPQCRREYSPAEKPTTYQCFCGKEIDPVPQPFLLPHSCGNICQKPLQPNCGHFCTLLCHPGPCPPCSQYTNTSCKCQKSTSKVVRCTEKQWQCDEKCNLILPCGHQCKTVCHPKNQCPPCQKAGKYTCKCGKETEKRRCFEANWKCKNVCDKVHDCGLHKCQKICHSGNCNECLYSLPRSCPCGKTKKQLPCSMDVAVCGETCQKLLDCGQHLCTQRCHKGDCNLCLITIKKKCRCKLREKEFPCSKDFICDTKCKQIRVCGKHTCNRKCCDKNCPPCEKVCGKPLSCGKHKCQSVCHKGPCFPCRLQSQINCSCGKTSKIVPCGRERTARVFCKEPCRKPSKCHHPNRHYCHKNDCPPCIEQCGLPNDTTKCTHICTAKCHSAIKISTSAENNNKLISYSKYNKKFFFKSLPHPKCETNVIVTCIGGHEVTEQPCWNSKPTSCQRTCNRQLSCGNHRCTLICHNVPNINDDKAQDSCISCKADCIIPRPEGCTHKCLQSCHLPPCKPCTVAVKTICHCGLMQLALKCGEYNMSGSSTDQTLSSQEQQRYRLKCCGTRCSKNYPCGHRCASLCHPGPCPNAGKCKTKLQIYCKCKRQKKEVSCGIYQEGNTYVECISECFQQSILDNTRGKSKVQVAFAKHKSKYKLAKEHRSEKRIENRSKFNNDSFGIYFLIVATLILATGLAFFYKS